MEVEKRTEIDIWNTRLSSQPFYNKFGKPRCGMKCPLLAFVSRSYISCPGLLSSLPRSLSPGNCQPSRTLFYHVRHHLLMKALNFCWRLLGLRLLLPGEREIPWVSSSTNIKMSSPRLLIYFFTHTQFLRILLSWYETWGTKNIFLSMQIYFKLIWRRKWRLHKCWQLIILSAWVLRHQWYRLCPLKTHENGNLSFLMLLSASIRPCPNWESPCSSAQLVPKWWKSEKISEFGNWMHEFKYWLCHVSAKWPEY